jgi:hypothetical protein
MAKTTAKRWWTARPRQRSTGGAAKHCGQCCHDGVTGGRRSRDALNVNQNEIIALHVNLRRWHLL